MRTLESLRDCIKQIYYNTSSEQELCITNVSERTTQPIIIYLRFKCVMCNGKTYNLSSKNFTPIKSFIDINQLSLMRKVKSSGVYNYLLKDLNIFQRKQKVTQLRVPTIIIYWSEKDFRFSFFISLLYLIYNSVKTEDTHSMKQKVCEFRTHSIIIYWDSPQGNSRKPEPTYNILSGVPVTRDYILLPVQTDNLLNKKQNKGCSHYYNIHISSGGNQIKHSDSFFSSLSLVGTGKSVKINPYSFSLYYLLSGGLK